jgi:hypothetical protein
VEQADDADDLMMYGVHESGCIVVTKFELAARIAGVCRQIDQCYGNAPGTAARGLFGPYFPPSPSSDLSVLRCLLDDARDFLDLTDMRAA